VRSASRSGRTFPRTSAGSIAAETAAKAICSRPEDAVEIRRKYPLAVRARLSVVHPAESRPFPGGLIAFDDKRAHGLSVAVMVSDKRAVLVAAKGERETCERLRRAVHAKRLVSSSIFG